MMSRLADLVSVLARPVRTLDRVSKDAAGRAAAFFVTYILVQAIRMVPFV